MSGRILEIDFKFSISPSELAEGFAPLAEVSKHPALSDISAKQFDVIDGFSAITRGPV